MLLLKTHPNNTQCSVAMVLSLLYTDTTDTKCLEQNVNSGLNREQHGQNNQLMFQLSQTVKLCKDAHFWHCCISQHQNSSFEWVYRLKVEAFQVNESLT